MGYLFLVLALASGLTKGFCGKKTSGGIVCRSDSMVINVLRMVLCIVIGFLLMLFQRSLSDIVPDRFLLLVSLLSGVATAAFVVSWLLSVRQNAYMLLEVFMLISTIVPIVLCRIFFEEEIKPLQILGIAVLALSVLIMCTYNVSIKGKISFSSILLMLFCSLTSGMADFSQKLYVKEQPSASIAAFNFYTYIVAALALLVACYFFRREDRQKGEEPRRPMAIIKPLRFYVLVMAVCLFANSFFKTKAALYLDAVYLYPLLQGSGVVLSLLMSAIFFKEKINAKCIVGLSLAFVALMMINFL